MGNRPLLRIPNQRVLVISHLYPSRAHPIHGRFIHEHVLALRGAGVEARVLVPVPWAPPLLRRHPRWQMYSDTLREPAEYEESDCRRLGYVTAPAPLHVFGGLGLALALGRVLPGLRREFAFDVLHAHCLTPDGWAACLAGRRLGVPVISSARGSDVNLYPRRSRVVRSATRYVLRRSSALVAVSRALAQMAAQLGGPGVTPQVIYNGVSAVFLRPSTLTCATAARVELGLVPDRRIILFVGALQEEKGVLDLLEAFGQLRARHPAAHLVLLGDGPLRRRVEQIGREAGTAGFVSAPGAVTHERVAAYARASDAFAFPSHAEGMPNALLEAMAAGLPCVATRVGGIPEAVEDGESGFLVPARAPVALAAALSNILDDPELAGRLGTQAARTIAQRFSWPANALAHIELYRTVLERVNARSERAQ